MEIPGQTHIGADPDTGASQSHSFLEARSRCVGFADSAEDLPVVGGEFPTDIETELERTESERQFCSLAVSIPRVGRY